MLCKREDLEIVDQLTHWRIFDLYSLDQLPLSLARREFPWDPGEKFLNRKTTQRDIGPSTIRCDLKTLTRLLCSVSQVHCVCVNTTSFGKEMALEFYSLFHLQLPGKETFGHTCNDFSSESVTVRLWTLTKQYRTSNLHLRNLLHKNQWPLPKGFLINFRHWTVYTLCWISFQKQESPQ